MSLLNKTLVILVISLMSLDILVSCALTTLHKPEGNSWGSLRHKLNQILDSESKEVGILQNLLTESENSLSQSEDSGKDLSDRSNNEDNHVHQMLKDDKKESSTGTDVSALREQGIIKKLEENSKRMDTMMVFFTDLRNVLSEAISAQSKQMSFESEVVELREEIEFLRKEMHILKQDQSIESLKKGSSLENKLQNDETTIQWLKDSTKELRNQINEMSRSCNASTLLRMEQKLEQQTQRQQSDLVVIQRQIEAIQVQQLQQDEQITEANGNILDVRAWQTNMGQKFIETQATLSEDLRKSNEITANEMSAEEHFLTEELKEASKPSPPTRHARKLRDKLRDLTHAAKQLALDHYRLHKRLVKLEDTQKTVRQSVASIKQKVNTDDRSSSKGIGGPLDSRLSRVEQTMTEYTLTLQNLGDKISVVNELQESTSQLFSALEGLETRYDEKLTDMQTSLAKIEASVSSVTNTNEDLKEQQTYQTSQLQSVKKNLFATQGKLQTNHLRLASIQSQLLKSSAQKCSVENSESIQNIRISSLESLLQTNGKPRNTT